LSLCLLSKLAQDHHKICNMSPTPSPVSCPMSLMSSCLLALQVGTAPQTMFRWKLKINLPPPPPLSPPPLPSPAEGIVNRSKGWCAPDIHTHTLTHTHTRTHTHTPTHTHTHTQTHTHRHTYTHTHTHTPDGSVNRCRGWCAPRVAVTPLEHHCHAYVTPLSHHDHSRWKRQ
jgi:hypothetical protein